MEGAGLGYYPVIFVGPVACATGQYQMALTLIRPTFCVLSLFRIFARQQLIQLIAAHMTEVLSLHEVEDVFADILAAVTDTLDRTRAEQRGQHA